MTAASDQFWTQDSPGIQDTAETGDRFGEALAAGDVDGDGLADLAIGVWEDLETKSDAGAVHVLYGSPTGLIAANDQFWNQDSAGIRGRARRGDNFGWALASADFSGDGTADLAIGVPGEDVKGIGNPGAVTVLYGSAVGLDAANSQIWTQDRPGVKDAAEPDDWFGISLASQ